jgi:hypothetical protein
MFEMPAPMPRVQQLFLQTYKTDIPVLAAVLEALEVYMQFALGYRFRWKKDYLYILAMRPLCDGHTLRTLLNQLSRNTTTFADTGSASMQRRSEHQRIQTGSH